MRTWQPNRRCRHHFQIAAEVVMSLTILSFLTFALVLPLCAVAVLGPAGTCCPKAWRWWHKFSGGVRDKRHTKTVRFCAICSVLDDLRCGFGTCFWLAGRGPTPRGIRISTQLEVRSKAHECAVSSGMHGSCTASRSAEVQTAVDDGEGLWKIVAQDCTTL